MEKIQIDRYKRMYEVPLQDVNVHCAKCELLKLTHEKKVNGTMTMDDLGKLREKCTICSPTRGGIYKADSNLGAYKPQTSSKLSKGKGKTSLIPKSTIEAVQKQLKEGVSYSVIAERTGLSKSTISRIKNGKIKNMRDNKPKN